PRRARPLFESCRTDSSGKVRALSRTSSVAGTRANSLDSGAADTRLGVSTNAYCPEKGLLLPRDKSQRCRVFALRPQTGVHLRPYHVGARSDSEAILSEQAGHATGPNRRHLHVFRSNFR